MTGLRALARRAGPELGWLSALFVSASLVLGFGLLAEKALEGDTAAFDRRVLLLFRDPADPSRMLGPSWLPEMFRDLTSLGSTIVLVLIVVLVTGYLALRRKWADMMLVIMAMLGGQVAIILMKLVFARARPDLIPNAPQVFSASFPSSHAMLSAVTYLTLGALLAKLETERALKWYFAAGAVFLTVAIGTSRVALGVHWPTDVLAGWCVGAAWAMICILVARRLRRRGQLESLSGPER